MTRSWLAFGLGVLLLLSPLRLLWARPGAEVSSVFVVWAVLVFAGVLVGRGRR